MKPNQPSPRAAVMPEMFRPSRPSRPFLSPVDSPKSIQLWGVLSNARPQVTVRHKFKIVPRFVEKRQTRTYTRLPLEPSDPAMMATEVREPLTTGIKPGGVKCAAETDTVSLRASIRRATRTARDNTHTKERLMSSSASRHPDVCHSAVLFRHATLGGRCSRELSLQYILGVASEVLPRTHPPFLVPPHFGRFCCLLPTWCYDVVQTVKARSRHRVILVMKTWYYILKYPPLFSLHLFKVEVDAHSILPAN